MSKISELSDGGSLQSTDYLIAVRSGGNVKVQPAGMTFSSVTITSSDINGGNIDGTVIGAATPAAGSFTTITGSDDLNIDSGTFFVDASADAVGIGTTSPGFSLEVAGNQRITKGGAGYEAGMLSFSTLSETGAIYRMGMAAGGAFAIGRSDTATTNITLDSSGNVGIGTTSPANGAKLHSAGAIISTDATLGSYNFNNAGFDFVSATKVARFFATSTDTTGGVMTFITGQNGSYGEAARLDASGNLLVGLTTPQGKLNINQSLSGAYGSAGIWLTDNATTSFMLNNVSSGVSAIWTSGVLTFGTGANNNTERMRLDASGNLLVGGTSAYAASAVTIASGGIFYASRNSGSPATFRRNSDDGAIVTLERDGTPVGSIGVTGGDLMIGQGAVGVRFLDSSPSLYPTNITSGATADASIDIGTGAARFKDLYLSGGVYLGGTGAANLLDDYEEGTWTPALTGNSAVTYAARDAIYTKIGNTVIAKCFISLSAWTGTASAVIMTGLPFTASSGNANYGSNPMLTDNLTSDLNAVLFQVTPGGTQGNLLSNCGRTGAHAGLAGTEMTASTVVRATIIYQTA